MTPNRPFFNLVRFGRRDVNRLHALLLAGVLTALVGRDGDANGRQACGLTFAFGSLPRPQDFACFGKRVEARLRRDDLPLQRLHYDFTPIPDDAVPQAVEPMFQHVVRTYASEWRALPSRRPHQFIAVIDTWITVAMDTHTK